MAYSGGVVYAGGTPTDGLSRFGDPITLSSGDPIPPGAYFSTAGWTIIGPPYTVSGNTITPTSTEIDGPGYLVSDGTATSSGGDLIPIGPRDCEWPWPEPWPLPGSLPELPTFA